MRRAASTVLRRSSAAARRSRRAFSSAAAQPEAASSAGEKLWIFDTTLRDGEQSPGATLTGDEKVDIAKQVRIPGGRRAASDAIYDREPRHSRLACPHSRARVTASSTFENCLCAAPSLLQLARLGVDICEAGFPIASQGDFEAVTRVAKTAGTITEGRSSGQTMRIAGLARANEKDIARCHEAVCHAPLHRIHTFLASSDIHLEHKLNISRAECLQIAAKMVAFAKTLVDDIEFSPEDAGRSDPDVRFRARHIPQQQQQPPPLQQHAGPQWSITRTALDLPSRSPCAAPVTPRRLPSSLGAAVRRRTSPAAPDWITVACSALPCAAIALRGLTQARVLLLCRGGSS